jgi:hypothetical protein
MGVEVADLDAVVKGSGGIFEGAWHLVDRIPQVSGGLQDAKTAGPKRESRLTSLLLKKELLAYMLIGLEALFA